MLHACTPMTAPWLREAFTMHPGLEEVWGSQLGRSIFLWCFRVKPWVQQ